MKIVSACLVGINCRYNGTNAYCKEVADLVRNGQAIPICPEQFAGLPTPREPVEIVGERIISMEGTDYTRQYWTGCSEAMRIVNLVDPDEAILKSKSPTCGCGRIYDGTFTRNLKHGDGILTQMLKKRGIKVRSEEDL
jgi:uncharacterized protein YbbK (DUF523 family)